MPAATIEAALARTPVPFAASLRLRLATLRLSQDRDASAASVQLDLALNSLKARKQMVGGATTLRVYRWQLCQASICMAERKFDKAQTVYLKVFEAASKTESAQSLAITQLARRGLVDVALATGVVVEANQHLQTLAVGADLESDDWLQSALAWVAFIQSLSATASAKETLLTTAESRLRRAVELNSNSSTHLCRLGQVLWERAQEHRIDKTRGCFSYWLRAAKLNRENADAFACLGRYYAVSLCTCWLCLLP